MAKKSNVAKATVEAAAVKAEASVAKNTKVTVENAVIKQVSSPATLQRVAAERGINPQEVFVRVVFEHEGKEFMVSNKLRFLTKAGYVELIDAQKNSTPVKLVVDVESGFFYIEHDVAVDDLFKEELPKATASKTELYQLITG